jgi:phosphatidate cytidylyltransferase
LDWPEGLRWVLAALFLVWTADTGAYFAGRWLGRRKLAPLVSPGKTWEGAAGGLLLVGLLAAWAAPLLTMPRLPFAALCLVVGCFSIVGDLIESLFKRHAGLKDSGRLLPGHGGMLDRIDSLLAATALEHNLVLTTRNLKDVAGLPVAVANPWEQEEESQP